jgi:hypothetical protein
MKEYMRLANPRNHLSEAQEDRLAELESELAAIPASKALRNLVEDPFRLRSALRGA